jgi:AraC-like DNA-binding protein
MLTPSLDLLAQNGVPVERELLHAKLPLQILDGREIFIPSLLFGSFLARVGQSQGIDNIGWRATQRVGLRILHPGFHTSIATSPTLYSGLRVLCALAYQQTSRVRCWWTMDDDTLYFFHRSAIPGHVSGYFEMTWMSLGVLISTIRLFLGPQWHPPRMGVPPGGAAGQIASELFPNTRFVPVKSEDVSSWVAIPRRHLNAPAIRNASVGPSLPDPTPVEEPKLDFVGSLKQAVQGYLRDGSPTIELAAEFAGVSARTLQRWLSHRGYTYSKLVDEARFEIARHLLIDGSGMRVADIGFEAGYRDQAHFTRAFQRIAGVGPREFRCLSAANADARHGVPNGASG